MLSASYVNLRSGKTKLFCNQGLILNVRQDNIHCGYYKDMLTFEKIDTDTLIFKYLFNPENSHYRTYFSSLLKKSLDFPEGTEGDNLYIDFYEKYKDKNFDEIEDIDIQDKILNYLNSIPVKYYERSHNNNEILITEPCITGVYGYDKLNMPDFMLDFAKKYNLPVYLLD